MDAPTTAHGPYAAPRNRRDERLGRSHDPGRDGPLDALHWPVISSSWDASMEGG